MKSRGLDKSAFGMRYDRDIKSVEDGINRLELDGSSVYLAISYFRETDIRQITYYIIPWAIKDMFKTAKGVTVQFYRRQMEETEEILKI